MALQRPRLARAGMFASADSGGPAVRHASRVEPCRRALGARSASCRAPGASTRSVDSASGSARRMAHC